jgi:predicted SprT family Zn-dependent metalloprotease
MSKFERLLISGSTERPDCRCGLDMRLFELRFDARRYDLERRVYRCDACHHELKLTVWTGVG